MRMLLSYYDFAENWEKRKQRIIESDCNDQAEYFDKQVWVSNDSDLRRHSIINQMIRGPGILDLQLWSETKSEWMLKKIWT